MAHNVLLIGGGGREHALADAISRAPSLGALHVSHPANPGLAALGRHVDVPVDIKQIYRLEQYLDKYAIDLIVVGPEAPLAEGFADALTKPGRVVFGPVKAAARLEADKAWAKQLMRSASVPTAEARSFTSVDAARNYLSTRDEPQVIKASGLAAGKGVIVCSTQDESLAALDRVMVDRAFGDAGQRVVIEERLSGPEVSVFALVDGETIYVLETCQDYKRLRDGGDGPNTGGMGAFSPSPLVDDALMSRIEQEILIPTIDALKREDIVYRGVLYAGLMLTHAGPKVIEFNVRFGDPECQVLMPRLESDAVQLMIATATGTLADTELSWRRGASCCVVLASEGYPDAPRTGVPITGVEDAESIEGVNVFHAGTKFERGTLLTAGGRVLNVAASGDTLEAARATAYEAASRITFPGRQMRQDIGA